MLISGEIEVDFRQRREGRGVYCHLSSSCLTDLSLKSRLLSSLNREKTRKHKKEPLFWEELMNSSFSHWLKLGSPVTGARLTKDEEVRWKRLSDVVEQVRLFQQNRLAKGGAPESKQLKVKSENKGRRKIRL